MITDFGSARMTSYTRAFLQTTTGNTRLSTLRWEAYEIIIQDYHAELADTEGLDEDEDTGGHHTKESDMWSFGMVIYVRMSFSLLAIDLTHPASRKS